MRHRPCFTLTLLAAFLAWTACDKTLPTETESISSLIVLTLSEESLAADGLSELTATATLGSDDPDPAKLDVQFETTGGKLLGGQAADNCQTGGAVSCIVVKADRGMRVATAQLRSSTTEGTVTVTAILLAVGTTDKKTVAFEPGESVLSFAGTAASGEADGETAIRVIVGADGRVAAGKMIQISASKGSFGTASGPVQLPLGLDSRAETQFTSLDAPGATILTATVVGETLAPARHEINFRTAYPASVTLSSSASTVAVGATVTLTAEYFRTPGAGSVTSGINPIWTADKVDDAGNLLVAGVGRLFDVSTIQPESAGSSRRTSNAKLEAGGLEAGDRIRITVAARDGGASAAVTVVVG